MTWRFVLLCVCTAVGALASDIPTTASNLAEVVAAEQRFSKRAREVGLRDSFLEFFAADVMTVGSEITVGMERWRMLPPAHPHRRFLVQWQPQYGGIADSGDLAWLTGPYWINDRGGEPTLPLMTGQYYSVWKKQCGEWRVILSVGVSIPQWLGPGPFVPAPLGRPGRKGIPAAVAKRQVLAAEQRLASQAKKRSVGSAICAAGAPQLRVHRAGKMPALGSVAACDLLARGDQPARLVNAGMGVSAAGDLAYTWGTYEAIAGAPAMALTAGQDFYSFAPKGFYARVWQRDAGTWKLVLDISGPWASSPPSLGFPMSDGWVCCT